jgi:hypothetical protein
MPCVPTSLWIRKVLPNDNQEPPKEHQQQQQFRMTKLDDNIKWFHQHCSSNYFIFGNSHAYG